MHRVHARRGCVRRRVSTGRVGRNTPSSTALALSYDSTTREYGQRKVVAHRDYGNLLLLVALSGYQAFPIQINPDASVFVGLTKLVFVRPF